MLSVSLPVQASSRCVDQAIQGEVYICLGSAKGHYRVAVSIANRECQPGGLKQGQRAVNDAQGHFEITRTSIGITDRNQVTVARREHQAAIFCYDLIAGYAVYRREILGNNCHGKHLRIRVARIVVDRDRDFIDAVAVEVERRGDVGRRIECQVAAGIDIEKSGVVTGQRIGDRVRWQVRIQVDNRGHRRLVFGCIDRRGRPAAIRHDDRRAVDLGVDLVYRRRKVEQVAEAVRRCCCHR